MNKLARGVFLIAVLLVVSLGVSYAGVIITPTGLSYQGRLTDAGGAPVSGVRDMTFSLYNSGSTLIYQETQAGITVVNGIFSVEIGTGTPVTGTFSGINFTTYDLFLGITVGADPEMTPRVHLGIVPYAMTARDAAGLSTFHWSFNNSALPRVNFGGGPTDLAGTSISVPGNGYVLLMANGQINTFAAGHVSVWFTTASGGVQDNNDYGYIGSDTTPGYFQFSRHKIYSVAAGTYSFYLEGQISSGAAGSYIWEPTITAIFIPVTMGGITLAPSAPAAAGARVADGNQ